MVIRSCIGANYCLVASKTLHDVACLAPQRSNLLPSNKTGLHSLIHDARLLGPWPMFVSTAVFYNHPWFWLLTSIKSAIGMPSYPPKLAAPNPQTPAANPKSQIHEPFAQTCSDPLQALLCRSFRSRRPSTKTPSRRLLCDCCGDPSQKDQLETRLTQPRTQAP